MTDLAIAHRGESINSGGDRVAWWLQRVLDCPLYVGYQQPDVEPDDLSDVRELFTDPVAQRAIPRGGPIRGATYLAEWGLNGQALDELAEYDTLVTAGLEPLFYCGPDSQVQIHYTHHTGRRHTDLLEDWPTTGLGGWIGRAYSMGVRKLIDSTTHRPDLFVANSEPVARRIHKYWGVPEEKIRVVYPPTPTETFSADARETTGYYLTLSRLDWHKRIDEIVDAFRDRDSRLIIAGDGSERSQLEAQASDASNIEFHGFVSEEEKRELLAGARGFVFNADEEDFGLAPVEALASGTPLIGVREGFTQHQIQDGKNGVSYERGHLRRALDRFERDGVTWCEHAISEFARQNFGVEQFRHGMQNAIRVAHDHAELSVDLTVPVNAIMDADRGEDAATDGGEPGASD